MHGALAVDRHHWKCHLTVDSSFHAPGSELAKRLPLKGADDAEGTVNSVKNEWQMVVENLCLVRHICST